MIQGEFQFGDASEKDGQSSPAYTMRKPYGGEGAAQFMHLTRQWMGGLSV